MRESHGIILVDIDADCALEVVLSEGENEDTLDEDVPGQDALEEDGPDAGVIDEMLALHTETAIICTIII